MDSRPTLTLETGWELYHAVCQWVMYRGELWEVGGISGEDGRRPVQLLLCARTGGDRSVWVDSLEGVQGLTWEGTQGRT